MLQSVVSFVVDGVTILIIPMAIYLDPRISDSPQKYSTYELAWQSVAQSVSH